MSSLTRRGAITPQDVKEYLIDLANQIPTEDVKCDGYITECFDSKNNTGDQYCPERFSILVRIGNMRIENDVRFYSHLTKKGGAL